METAFVVTTDLEGGDNVRGGFLLPLGRLGSRLARLPSAQAL